MDLKKMPLAILWAKTGLANTFRLEVRANLESKKKQKWMDNRNHYLSRPGKMVKCSSQADGGPTSTQVSKGSDSGGPTSTHTSRHMNSFTATSGGTTFADISVG
jgi:hypothetical protein